MQDDRLVYIQLEVTLRTGKRHGVVVAKHLDCHHRECLTLSGIDLSRHDGRAGFVFGNFDFTEAAARTAGVPTDIVPDLHQRPRKSAKRSAHTDHTVVCREGRKFVGSGYERLTGFFCDPSGSCLTKASVGIEPRTDCGATD